MAILNIFQKKLITNFLLNQIQKQENLPRKYIMRKISEDEFWKMFTQYINQMPTTTDDFVSFNSAQATSQIDRRALKRLVDDKILRGKDGQIARFDADLLGQGLKKISEMISNDFLKETKITGAKKYLMLDFHDQNSGKTLPEYKVELLLKLFQDFFGLFFDITPKKDVKMPPNLVMVAEKIIKQSQVSPETINLIEVEKAKSLPIHEELMFKVKKSKK